MKVQLISSVIKPEYGWGQREFYQQPISYVKGHNITRLCWEQIVESFDFKVAQYYYTSGIYLIINIYFSVIKT